MESFYSNLNDKEVISRLKDLKITSSDFVTCKDGSDLLSNFTILNEPLGLGSFSKVKKVKRKNSGKECALKIIPKSGSSLNTQQNFIKEVNILMRLDHPNIMKILHFGQDSSNFYIVSDLYTGGELFDRITQVEHFDEEMAAQTMQQLLSAIRYCHKHGIMHGNIKPENIVYETPMPTAPIRVIDFELSQFFDKNTKLTRSQGSPYYIAPEVIKGSYDERSDIWSCGVILYILLCGYPPFNSENDQVVMNKILQGKLEFQGEIWQNVSNEAKSFIQKMMERDVYLRFTAAQALNDPWLTKIISSEKMDPEIARKALNNLKKFKTQGKLQRAIWMLLASRRPDQAEKEKLMQVFNALDKEGDGKLSKQELMEGCAKLSGENISQEEIDEIMKQIDVDNNGLIDYSEFVMAATTKQNVLSEEKIKEAFNILDKDKKGYVGREDIKYIFGAIGKKIEDNVWCDLINEADENNDCMMSFEEFRKAMMK